MHALFVGADAGGSHTIAALARGDKLLRTIAGPGANPNLIGIDAAARVEPCIGAFYEAQRLMATS
jgi:N-acetylglucosamine kinase-like BadF-type ATPase